VRSGQRTAYLERLGVPSPGRPTSQALRTLHAAHLHRVPFENLSIHLDEDIDLDPDLLVDKVVERRRGGFCFELNGAFAALLATLGFQVELHGARVYEEDGRLGPPLDHLVLRVTCPADPDGTVWMADVGFGGDSPLWPLEFGTAVAVTDPLGPVASVTTEEGDADLVRAGTPRYRVEPRARELADFRGMCWYHRTSPDSTFTRDTICTRRTETGRISLSGRRLIVTVDGQRSERHLEDDDELLAAYREHFGIVLDRVPTR
jgi:N-hydroxyarylamine O-acetyltransferase